MQLGVAMSMFVLSRDANHRPEHEELTILDKLNSLIVGKMYYAGFVSVCRWHEDTTAMASNFRHGDESGWAIGHNSHVV